MKIEFKNWIKRLSFLCRLPDIKIAWINPCLVINLKKFFVLTLIHRRKITFIQRDGINGLKRLQNDMELVILLRYVFIDIFLV